MKQRLALVFRDPMVSVLVLLALCARLFQLPSRTLWYDEAYSAIISQQSLGDIWRLAHFDVHPPLFYLIVHLAMRVFGDSLWVIRGVSVVAGTLAVIAAALWLRVFAARRAINIALLLMALQPIAVRYSQEARMYALLAMWLMAASLTLAMWLRRPQQWRYPLLYAVFAAAALYTHYFAITGLASHWAFALLTVAGRAQLLRSRRWWLANVMAAMMFSPWLPVLWHQMHVPNDLEWIPPLTLASVPTTLWEFFWILDSPIHRWPALGLLPVAVLGYALWLTRRPQRWSDRHAVVCMLVMPFALTCVMSLVKPLFITRYLSFAALPMALLLAMAIDSVWRRYARTALLMLGMTCGVQFVGLINGYRLGELIDSPQGDRSGVGPLAALVDDHWRPGDETVVYAEDLYLSTLYYLRLRPTPWLWLEEPAPSYSGDSVLFYSTPRLPWLWHYAQTPPGTCGLWVFSNKGDVPPEPPASDWAPGMHREVYDTELNYYERRHCALANRY